MDHDLSVKDPGGTVFRQDVSVNPCRQSREMQPHQHLQLILSLPQHSPIRWAETFIQYPLHIQYEPGTPEAGRESHALIAEEISPAYKDGWKRKHNMWLHSVLKSGPQFNPVVADMTQGAHGCPRVEHGTGWFLQQQLPGSHMEGCSCPLVVRG